jgi:hypothetical protein
MEIDGIVGDHSKGMNLEENSDNTHISQAADECLQQPSGSDEPDGTLQSFAESYDPQAKNEVSRAPGKPDFLGLPVEIQTKVLRHVASFPDRGDAHQGLHNLRAVNRQLNKAIQEIPKIKQSYQNLQRHPRIASRVEAGVLDIDAGISAPEAVQANELINESDVDKVLLRAAIRDIDAGALAPKAVRDNGLTNKNDIYDMQFRAALSAILGGKSTKDAVSDNGMIDLERLSEELENVFR